MRRLLRTPRPLFAFVAALLLAACSPSEPAIKTKLPTPNPNPVERVKVTVEVTNAPGEFTSAQGLVQFQMTGETRKTCIPLRPFSGAAAVAWAGLTMPFELRKTSPTTFEGEAVLDQFVPNDDYGLGLCEWQTIGVEARLHNGINIHSVDMQLSLPGSGFEAGDEKHRLADGLYRGRRAFHKALFSRDRQTPESPPPKPGDDPVFFSGTYEDAKAPLRSEFFDNYYFITVTAQRMDPSP